MAAELTPSDARREAEAVERALLTATASQRSTYHRTIVGGALLGVGGLVVASSVSIASGAFASVFGGLLVFAGVWSLAQVRATALQSGAGDEIGRGRFDVGLALLDAAEKTALPATARRSVKLLRGYVSLVRGDLNAARAELDEALAVPAPRWTIAKLHDTEGLRVTALRALVAALGGDDETAMSDVRFVRSAVAEERFGRGVIVNEVWIRAVLARAALAEAVVLSRAAGAGPELARHLEEHGRLLREGTLPRERALFRGLVRLSRARKRSAYREPPKVERALSAPSPEAWVERLAPEVAAFLDRDRPVVDGGSAAKSKPASRPAVAPVRPARAVLDGSRRMLLLWIVVAVVFFVVWQFLDASASRTPAPTVPLPAPPARGFSIGDVLPYVGVLAAAFGLVAWQLRAVFRRIRLGNTMMRRLALGEPLQGSDQASARTGGFDLVAMMRCTALSRTALNEARFADALASADAAFVETAKLKGKLLGEFHGTLSEARARALAALGRAGEARGEVQSWPRDYSHRTSGAIAVELLAALREGDLEHANEVARRVTDELPLDVRTEALLDLLRAKRGAIGLVDRERLQEDLRAPELRRFVSAVAPDLLADFEKESTESSGADEEAKTAAERDDEAEREDEAAAEAEGAVAQGATARIDRK